MSLLDPHHQLISQGAYVRGAIITANQMGSATAMLLLLEFVAAVAALLATSATAQYWDWNSGTATFYGGRDGSGTMGTCVLPTTTVNLQPAVSIAPSSLQQMAARA